MRADYSFKNKVYSVVKEIRRGDTMSYKEVAEKAGYPKAWRVVGNVLNKNKSTEVPCHRVIKSSGEIGGHKDGTERDIYSKRKECYKN